MKKAIIAILLVALFVVPAFANTHDYSSVAFDMAYGKDGFELRAVDVNVMLPVKDYKNVAFLGYSLNLEEPSEYDGFYLSAASLIESSFINDVNVRIQFSNSLKDFKVNSIDLGASYKDTVNNKYCGSFGCTYSLDKDPAKSGLNFGYQYSDYYNFKTNGKLHMIDAEIKLEDFEAVVTSRYANVTYGVRYYYSYDKPAEVNGIYANVNYTTKTSFNFHAGVIASAHFNDGIKFEINDVEIKVDKENSFIKGDLGLVAEYVYAFDNEASENGFFMYLFEQKKEPYRFSVNFKVEDFKIADWSFETLKYPDSEN